MRINIYLDICIFAHIKIYDHCAHTLVIIKKLLLFFFNIYKYAWKEHKFRRQKNNKKKIYNNKKIFQIDDVDVDKILVYKKNHMAQRMHLNTFLDIMIMMLLSHV